MEDLEPSTETPVSATATFTPLSVQETSEPQFSQTVAVTHTAVPTGTASPTSTPLARTTPIRRTPTPTPPATVTAVFTKITPNPDEPPCPRPDDLAEKEVDISGEPFCIVWIDPFDDETGFQVILEYFQGDQPNERFVYEVAPNVTQLIVPEEDTPRLGESVEQCMRRHSWGIRIVAFRQQIEWPFAGMGVNVECGSFDSTPLPTATPYDFPVNTSNSIINIDYGLAWPVPVGWQEIPVPEPSTETVFWQAWMSSWEIDSASYLPGQMILTMFVENDTSGMPAGTEQRTVWDLPVWIEETEGTSTDEFNLRLSLTTVREPYEYNYRLDCIQLEGSNAAEQAAFEAFCHYTWDFLFRFFGLCAVPMEQTDSFAEWQQVSDDWYQYFFLVPRGWLKLQGPTPDRINFFSDPLVYNQPNQCSLPNGLMKIDFSVDPPGNFGTGAPGSAPDTTGFTETTIAEQPAWIQTVTGGELMGPADLGITVYIKGGSFWYHFWLLCIPPTNADATEQEAFKAQCQDAFSQILDSFQIR